MVLLRNARVDARGDAYVLPHFDELRCDNLPLLNLRKGRKVAEDLRTEV